MILIITHKEDFTADFVIEKLNEKGIEYFRFNCEDINVNNYSFDENNLFEFEINGIKNFDSVWFRRTKLPNVNLNSEAENLFILGDYESLLSNMFQILTAKKWLSHPKFVYEAENKILQLKTAVSLSLNVPDTLITNCHNKLLNFSNKHDNNIIIKPIRQGRLKEIDGHKSIFTNKIDFNKISSIKDYDLTPCIFQEYIDKDYEIRVTVVGKKVFSASVNSQANEETKIDWRKEKLPFKKYNLPKFLENKCVELVEKLNLSFGAIDFIKDKKGNYVFLEINPNGQWAWLEMEANLEISDAIINFLIDSQ